MRLSRSGIGWVLLGVLASVSWLEGRGQAQEPAKPHETIPLWPHGVPGAKGTDPDKDVPTLTIWQPQPELAKGSAVVVCPGGGYGMLAM